MKKTLLISVLFIFFVFFQAKALDPFYYSTIAIDEAGQVVDNAGIDVRITIENDLTALYTETFTNVQTSQFAVFTIFIGSTNPPEFTQINAQANTRLKIEANNGSRWVLCERVLISEISGNMINTISNYAWMLSGNNGTNPSNNFIGTTDAQGLVLRTNNLERVRVADNGFVGINNPTPVSLLDILHPSTPSEPYIQRIWSGWKNVWGINEYLFTQVGFLRIDQNAPHVVRYYSGYFVAEVDRNNTDNISPRIVPLQGQMDHFGSGTLNETRGVAGFINNRSNSGGTITNAYGGYFAVNNFHNGTIGNAHTVYIHNGAQNGTINNKSGITINNITGATNNTNLLIGTATIPTGDYSIYDVSAKDSYFSGNLGVGTMTPARKLHVSDVMRLEPRATAPSSPSEGDMYMDSSTHKLRVYDGTTWQDCW
jgi:hypothetical protein